MCVPTRYLLLALTALPLVSSGCSTSRQHLAQRDSPPLRINQANDQSLDMTGTPDVHDVPEVQTVAFREDETEEASDDSADSAIQLAVPVEVEGFAMGNSGMTLEAIEQLALANNPAIQQASAASARAGGIRTQVGLKPNPTIGYFGEEIGNEGAGGLHGAFVSQTFVRGDKLAWNRQVLGHDVNAMNWQIETQRQRVRTDIRLAFYDALAAQKTPATGK